MEKDVKPEDCLLSLKIPVMTSLAGNKIKYDVPK